MNPEAAGGRNPQVLDCVEKVLGVVLKVSKTLIVRVTENAAHYSQFMVVIDRSLFGVEEGHSTNRTFRILVIDQLPMLFRRQAKPGLYILTSALGPVRSLALLGGSASLRWVLLAPLSINLSLPFRILRSPLSHFVPVLLAADLSGWQPSFLRP